MKNKYSKLLFIILIIAVMGPILSRYFLHLNYLKYISLILVPLLIFKEVKKVQHAFILPYILLIAYTIVRVDNWSFTTLAYILFWLAAITPFMVPKYVTMDLKLLNKIFFLGPIFYVLNNGVVLDFSPESFATSSTSSIESNFNLFSFIYTLFFVYWLSQKNKKMALLNVIFVILTFKRIAVVTIPLVFLLSLINFNKIKGYKIQILMIVINSLYLFFSYTVSSGQLNKIIKNASGISPGEFTMGRITLYNVVYEKINQGDITDYLFGYGAGTSTLNLKKDSIQMLHNDILKIFFENGLVIFVVFFYLMYRKLSKEQLLLTFTINIFFLTDNTLIYTPVLLVYFTLMLYLYYTNKRQKLIFNAYVQKY